MKYVLTSNDNIIISGSLLDCCKAYLRDSYDSYRVATAHDKRFERKIIEIKVTASDRIYLPTNIVSYANSYDEYWYEFCDEIQNWIKASYRYELIEI